MTRDLFDIIGEGRGPRHIDDDDQVENVKLRDFEMVLHHQTKDAILVSNTGEESKAVWLPKSKVEINRDGKTVNAVKKDGQRIVLPASTITIPEWLAKAKGLI